MIPPIGEHFDDLQELQAYLLQSQNANAVLLAVARLRLLDGLDDGPKTAAEIAAAAGLRADKLFRVLRFLAAQAIIDCDEQGRFVHTARSRLLQSCQSGLRFIRESIGAASGLAECLETGRPAFDCSFGMPIFEYLSRHPETVRYFGDLMSRTTAIVEAFVFGNHRFEPFELAVDVGGSHGRLMMHLLSRHPTARGIVFDTPNTAEQAAAMLAGSAVADRAEARGGDFFAAVPAGGDLYLLKQILHDWNDEECVRILQSIRAAISDRGRLAVIEYLLPERPVPHSGFAMDVHMMVLSTGRERTLSEYTSLFEAAGFVLDRVTGNPEGQSVAEVIPALPGARKSQ